MTDFAKKERRSNSKILLYSLISIIFVFIAMHLYVLTRVGVQGERITQIKEQQNKIKMENEIKQAEIQKLQSRAIVLDSIENLGMSESDVILISSQTKTANE